MSGSIDKGKLHVWWSNQVKWKQGLVSLRRAQSHVYPMYGRPSVERGERVFWYAEYYVLSLKYKSRGITFHWYPHKKFVDKMCGRLS